MLQSDDWKGEHLIRAVPREQTAKEIAGAMSSAQNIVPAIRALADKGLSTSRIADVLGVTISRVSHHAIRNGIFIQDGRNLRKKHR